MLCWPTRDSRKQYKLLERVSRGAVRHVDGSIVIADLKDGSTRLPQLMRAKGSAGMGNMSPGGRSLTLRDADLCVIRWLTHTACAYAWAGAFA